MIPLIAGVLYRWGGSDKFKWLPNWFSQKTFRWVMGIPISIITHNWWYALTYFVATNIFVYGDDSWASKLLGRKGARLLHGFMFGIASLVPLYSIWCAVAFYILFELAEDNVIDNKWSEFLRGCLGTLIFLWR